MTKERQTQIMKPIKVLSLVLLALLLLVPAASAETYTIIDEDMVFGGGSGTSGGVQNVEEGSDIFGSDSEIYGLLSSFVRLSYVGDSVWTSYSLASPLNADSAYDLSPQVSSSGAVIDTRISGYILGSDTEDFRKYKSGATGYFVPKTSYYPVLTSSGSYTSQRYSLCSAVYYQGGEVVFDKSSALELLDSKIGSLTSQLRVEFGFDTGSTSSDVYYGAVDSLSHAIARYFSETYLGSYVAVSYYGSNSDGKGYYDSSSVDVIITVVGLDSPVSESATQHVTVTYDDQSENYQVYVDTSDESVDVWVRGYVFGWLPVWTFGSNSFPPSTHFEWLTCPVRLFFWDVDWEVEVECNGESKFIYWNLDSLPIIVPPPDPPFPDPDPELPDDPDPFDPTNPFPTPSYNPSGLPNKIPTSLKEIIGFNLTEIKDRFKESTPFYSNAFDFVASAIEALFDFLFGLIGVTLGVLIGFLSEPLTEIYNFIVWTSSVVFSFMDFLIIPNHIMSFLADFVPVEIVNLALAALGLDILLNVLSIAIPDLITAYKSTVRTYYHKVDHGIQKGGKK